MSRERGEQWAVARVALSFVASIAGAVGFGVAYVEAGAQLQGSFLALALLGLGVGLVLWSRELMPSGPDVDEREELILPERETAATAATFERGEAGIRRRGFLGKLLAVAAGTLGLAALFPIRSLGPGPGDALRRTSWQRGSRVVTEDGQPVAADELPVGGVLTVFPEGHVGDADAQTILVRVDPLTFTPLPGREAWAPEGNVAYSKVCTHAGCPVGLYQVETNRLFCPCHQSAFDVLNGASPRFGPATRPLPQLPLDVDDVGNLVARGDYPQPVGPGFWTLPS